jgi:hypothetical protein
VVSRTFAKEVNGLQVVMPAKAGIQNHSIFRRFPVALPHESGDHASLPGMTFELRNELLKQNTSDVDGRATSSN